MYTTAEYKATAVRLLREWQGGRYIFGRGVFQKLGGLTAALGKRVLLIASGSRRGRELAASAGVLLRRAGCELLTEEAPEGGAPNSPTEDVFRLAAAYRELKPEVIVVIGGGSAIDAAKAANIVAALEDIFGKTTDPYCGSGLVSELLNKYNRKLTPLVAVETAASSGTHLTCYANVTYMEKAQKKVIIDPAVVPAAALFDYDLTATTPLSVTIDGALDAIAHTYEVYCGARPAVMELTKALFETALPLVLEAMPRLLKDPQDGEARELLGLASDLGGYAIMAGSTSGGHLTSFSLVGLVHHGTACGIMNPYYTIYYAPNIPEQLESAAEILSRFGYLERGLNEENCYEKALRVAEAMLRFNRAIGAPVSLGEIPGFHDGVVRKIIEAAKDPQLAMKLAGMPVPMTGDQVDERMTPIIHAAASGDLNQLYRLFAG